MTVSPIDVIARSEGFESAAEGHQLRPWEWAFIHACDGRLQLHEVAEKCGLSLDLATDIVLEQSRAGLLRVVTMTLDDYRQWSGIAPSEPARRAMTAAVASPVAEPVISADEPAIAVGEHLVHAAALDEAPTDWRPAHAAFDEEADAHAAVPSAPPFDAALVHEAETHAETTTDASSRAFAPEPFGHEPFAAEPFAAETTTAEPPSHAFAFEPFDHAPFAAEPIRSEPEAHESVVHGSLPHEPAARDPFAHEPFAHDVFAPEGSGVAAGAADAWNPVGAASEPVAHEALALEPASDAASERDPFAYEPFAQDSLAHEPVTSAGAAPHETFPLEVRTEAPDPFAFEPFAYETVASTPEPAPPAHEPIPYVAPALDPFAHEPFAYELPATASPEPVATDPHDAPVPAKGVSISFDSFDAIGAPEPPATPAEPSPDRISLSFEPGSDTTHEALPSFPSSATGVSFSFGSGASPLPTFDSPVAPPLPEPPTPETHAAPAAEREADRSQPISLSFSPDGFPILTTPAEPPAPLPEAPLPQPAAQAPAAEAPAPAPVPAAATPVANAPKSANESGDVVGSLIARVLSIRIK